MSTPRTVRLMVSSGDGPKECRRAVALLLSRMAREAADEGVPMDSTVSAGSGTGDVASAVVTLRGEGAARFAARWTGTTQWISQSPFRPHHKRRNWFVGVFLLAEAKTLGVGLDPADVRFDTFRAGGPGGQHQNTTDSAVRATHVPSGLSAVAKDERSQHRNRRRALERLQAMLFLRRQQEESRRRTQTNQLHRRLQRGNPVRRFCGDAFRET